MTAMPVERHAGVPMAPLAVSQISAALDGFCAENGVPGDAAWRLRVAIDEVVANIIGHGRPAGGAGMIDVWFRREGDWLEIRVADDGVPFDPVSGPEPDLAAPLDARGAGGLGIVLIKGLMDEVSYQRTNRNILILRKRLDAPLRKQ